MTYLLTEAVTEGREDLALYRSRGGYEGPARAQAQGPASILLELSEAGLRGRGGSGRGRPVADKWAKVAKATNRTRYVVANGAESSAVSQKDRFLMRHYPHRVLEGLLAAASVTSAEKAYLYIRGDAAEAIASMEEALAEARGAGLLPIEVEIQTAIPSYIAGEETAVIDALEGLEGLPQPKPPHPEEAGLRGCPTVISNVESLAAAAAVLRVGAARFREAGAPFLYTVAGDVANPGVYEVAYGTPLRTLLDRAGAPPSAELAAVLPGGLSSGPLRPDELDLPLTYESLAGAGSTIGPAAAVVLGKETRLADFAADTLKFLAESSCGQCRACKDTSKALAGAMAERDANRARELAALLLHGRGNCGHPGGAAQFALRALQAFPAEWRSPK